MIIDVHAHTYPERIIKKVKERMEHVSGSRIETNGTPEGLIKSMKDTGIDYSVFLPVATNPKQVGKLNAQVIQAVEQYGDKGFLAFAAIHPDTQHVREVLQGIKKAGLRGIKIHPDYQDTFFDDIRYLRIIDIATELELLIMAHAGMDEVYPDLVHCDVKRILKVIREVRSERLILAHMGGWQMWEEVRKDICGAPVYFDTAFSLTGTVNVENKNGFGPILDDTEFVKLVRAHGADRILFGTDFPWSSQRENLEWIQGCSLTEPEKRMILGENAAKILFGKS